ncbi:MAG: hypothetical protein A2136_10580 [Chloroflexi bacterium RBG_16_54_11]|nr:MAG: hypothetical protein A2136_10580 [Chloroflexi bacterium RBG_16_54_11]
MLAFYPLVRIIATDWDEIRDILSHIRWENLLFSLFLLFLVLPLMASISWVSLRYLGVEIPAKKVLGVYFLSQLAKYLPGGIWAFPGRMLAYQSVGIDRERSIASVFREVSALVLSSVAVSLLIVFHAIPISNSLRWALIFGGVASISAILITQTAWFWRLLERLRIKKPSLIPVPPVNDMEHLTRLNWLPAAFLAGMVFWLAMGLPFQQLSRAIGPASYPLSWLGTAAVFAFAWTVGFVVFFTPAGLGVRESVLVLLLSTFLPAGQAVSIALLSRLAWIVIEAAWILISIWLSRDRQKVLPATP